MSHIAIVTDAWYPQVNGVVRAVDALKKGMEGRGIKVSIIHPGLFKNVPMPLYREIRLALFPRRHLRYILNELNPNAIHIATPGPLGTAARRICKKRKWAFTAFYHTHFPLHVEARIKGFTPLVFAWLRWFHNAADKTLVSTRTLEGELTNRGFKNVVVCPLGVDVDFFVRNSQPSIEKLSGPVFCFFGRISPEKNIKEFLELDLPGVKVIIGDGPQAPALRARYGKRALFVGYKRGQELVDWLSRCDVLVFPSRSETLGLAVIEALACGVRVAAHDVMGPRDVIENGVDGYLSEDLRDAALKCLSLSREECRKKALKFSWGASVDSFLRLQTCTDGKTHLL